MPDEIRFSDATATITRGVKFVPPVQGFDGGDRIIVKEDTGHQDDFMIVQADGQPKVKRVVQKLAFDVAPSPAVSATSRVVHDLADVDAATEKRALAIYKKFSA